MQSQGFLLFGHYLFIKIITQLLLIFVSSKLKLDEILSHATRQFFTIKTLKLVQGGGNSFKCPANLINLFLTSVSKVYKK